MLCAPRALWALDKSPETSLCLCRDRSEMTLSYDQYMTCRNIMTIWQQRHFKNLVQSRWICSTIMRADWKCRELTRMGLCQVSPVSSSQGFPDSLGQTRHLGISQSPQFMFRSESLTNDSDEVNSLAVPCEFKPDRKWRHLRTRKETDQLWRRR